MRRGGATVHFRKSRVLPRADRRRSDAPGARWRDSGSNTEWDSTPEEEVAEARDDRCHDSAGPPDRQVESQENDPASGQGHQYQPGYGDSIGCLDEPLPPAASEQ